jgi:hypothetical protein
VGHRARPPLLDRQPGLRAVQRLDPALLVHRENYGVLGRVQVQTDDVLQFLRELRVVADLERPPPGAASGRAPSRSGRWLFGSTRWPPRNGCLPTHGPSRAGFPVSVPAFVDWQRGFWSCLPGRRRTPPFLV